MLKQKMRIIKIGINGEGIGYVNKIPVFVEGALVDELVEIEILENFGSYMKAKTVRVIEKSPFRVKPRCSLSEKCGGCSMMICNYKKQLEYKKELLRETLKKYANIDGSIIEDVVPNPTPFNYRNQCKLPVKWLKGTLYSGMYEANSSRLVYMDDCQVHEKGLDKTRMAIMKVLNKYGFRDYNDQIERGIRTIVLRGFDGKYQCTLVTGKMKIEEEVIEEIMNIEGVKSLYQSVNISKKNIETFGKEFIHLGGTKTLELKIDGIVLRLSPASFFQLNLEQAKNLYKTAISLLEPCGTLVEAYSGIGAISLLAKDKAENVIGIEFVRDAVKNANNNARLNHCEDKVKFVSGDAGEEMKYIAKKGDIDALIVDPPRAGLDEAMIENILRARPKQVIYISCNPATLGRNLNDLLDRYDIKRIIPFDMFSQTPHIETLCILRRKAH